jgi:hypothetical protein
MTDQEYNDLLAQVGSDPERLRALLEAAVSGDQMALAQRQLGVGQDLFATPGAQGREVGRTYVASSPLEHLSVALRQGIGAKRMQDALTQQQTVIDQKKKGMNTLLEAIAGAGRPRSALAQAGAGDYALNDDEAGV